MDLTYRSFVDPDDLLLNECTIRRVTKDGQAVGWGLWFVVARVDNGRLELFRVTVSPYGPFVDNRSWKTWGLNPAGSGMWQISPSINYGDTVWHQTPRIVGVPAGEQWALK